MSFDKIAIKKMIKPENGIETAIVNDAEFILGVNYGKSRPGHPEGQVIFHIMEVLANVDKYANEEDRKDLRLIAILHDSFKYKVDRTKPRVGENHHGLLAARFSEKYIKDLKLHSIITHHDDAFHAWQKGYRHNDWYKADVLARKLISMFVVEGCLDLFVKFYFCDNQTGDKSQNNYDWFVNLIH